MFAERENRIKSPAQMVEAECFARAGMDLRNLISDLVASVEQIKPGHKFGRARAQQVKALADNCRSLRSLLGIDTQEALVLDFILRAHDIGRHLQALNDSPQAGDKGAGHGALGAGHLAERRVLANFPDALARTIALAIEHHADEELPGDLNANQLKFCRLTRDFLNFYYLNNTNFLNPNGIAHQIGLHFSKCFSTEVAANPYFARACQIAATTVRIGGACPEFGTRNDITKLFAGVFAGVSKIIQGTVPEQAITAFCSKQAITLEQIGDSYAALVLYSLARIFKIKSPALINSTLMRQTFQAPLTFALARCREPNKISAALEALKDESEPPSLPINFRS